MGKKHKSQPFRKLPNQNSAIAFWGILHAYKAYLHYGVTDGQLFDHFAEYKSLASVRICRDFSTRRSLCYGYVNFISAQDGNASL